MVLDCELSKEVDVMWYHNEAEVKSSKMVSIKAEGKRRTLSIRRVGDTNKGQYVCDCGTDKTTATLNIEGKATVGPSREMFLHDQDVPRWHPIRNDLTIAVTP